ncbi:MAG: NADAR family protein [Gammaproteobacteria bacterium]|nr:NADAR family protein [Gammaproteobacteria bacterium]MDH5801193.1 NADAR family protein [Gammaproteobacteria bacterium]
MTIVTKADLVDHLNGGNQVRYLFFWGHQEQKNEVTKSCLSQWYDSPFESNGVHFATAEHYMMYHKAILFGDALSADKALKAPNPGKAKAIGRRVKGFTEKTWEKERFEIVVNANLAKFGNNGKLRQFLLNTGNRVLVEASPVDKIWGVGMSSDNPAIENPNLWKGLNLLGFALMLVRDRLT